MHEPKTLPIKLFGEDLLLSERLAKDVNKLYSLAKSKKEKEYSDILFETVIIVSDSLKLNIRNLRWYQLIKKYRIRKYSQPKYLLANLSSAEIFNLAQEIYKLEGIVFVETEKKKS